MDFSTLAPTLIGVAIGAAIYKFAPNQMVKAAALGAIGVMVLKRLPYTSAALA